jgi:hypothetical protein
MGAVARFEAPQKKPFIAIQRPYHAAKSTTCARAAQVMAAPSVPPSRPPVAPNPRPHMGAMEHEQGREGVTSGAVGVRGH